MRTIRYIYHLSMVIFPILGVSYLTASLIRLIINVTDPFYVICLAIMIAVLSKFLLIPAIKDLRTYQNRENQ